MLETACVTAETCIVSEDCSSGTYCWGDHLCGGTERPTTPPSPLIPTYSPTWTTYSPNSLTYSPTPMPKTGESPDQQQPQPATSFQVDVTDTFLFAALIGHKLPRLAANTAAVAQRRTATRESPALNIRYAELNLLSGIVGYHRNHIAQFHTSSTKSCH